MSAASDILRRGADWLERNPHRWRKGYYGFRSDGSSPMEHEFKLGESGTVERVCAIGACALVERDCPTHVKERLVEECPAGAVQHLISCNDREDTTLEHVVSRMRSIADACR